jgi:hypothetical protein
MPDTAQWVAIVIALLTGTFGRDLVAWLRAALKGRNAARRTEVDRAIAERDKARQERDAAQSETSWWARWARIVEESLGLHRRQMIDASCIRPEDLPPYPNRPPKE